MKVLQINAVSGSGSTGSICADIADTLKSDGNEVKIVYGNGKSAYPDSVRAGSDLSVKVNAAYARISGLGGYFAPIETKKIIDIIKSFSPDIVHLHNLHANYVNVHKLLRYLGENNIVTVITLHDCWFFTGKCTHYISESCKKWQSGCGKCPQLKNDIPSLFFDRTAKMWKDKKSDFKKIRNLAVIGVSDWITGEAEKSFLKNAKIVKRIYNWVDLDVFNSRKKIDGENSSLGGSSGEPNKFTIFCASAGWEKGTERFNDLLKLAEIIDSSMQIVAAGRFDEAVTLPPNVIKAGYIKDPAELAEYYRNADVYVHLSRADTFGKVIAEAVACGTPAIVYNATACPEIVSGGCGYAVKCGDINAIVKKCEEIMHMGKKCFSEACRASAERFNKDLLIKETIDVYKELLK